MFVSELKPIMWCTANFLYKILVIQSSDFWRPQVTCFRELTERGGGGSRTFLCKTRRTNFQTANILRWSLVNAVMNFCVP